MKSTILCLGAIFFLAHPAFCHLGENPVECQTRYGDPLEQQTDDYGNRVLLYKKNGFDIFITFLDDKASKVQYGHSIKKFGIGDPISENETELLLKANYSGTWKKDGVMGKSWESDDGNFFADAKPFTNILFVCTKEYIAVQNAAKKAKETKNLEGL
jgi:hypothetical protein